MTDPILPYPLKITSGSNTDAGATVTVENVTKANFLDPDKNRENANLDGSNRATIDIANLRSGYDNGDKLRIKAVGIRVGTAYHTVDTTKQKGTIVLSETSADYAGAAVSL